MIARAALGEQVEKRIRLRDADRAEDVGAAAQKGVRKQTDGRPDDRDARLGPRHAEQVFERVVEQRRAGDQQHVGLRHDFAGRLGRAEKRHFVGFERRRVLFEHEIRQAAPLQLLEERNKGADDDGAVAGAESLASNASTPARNSTIGCGRMSQQRSASAFKRRDPDRAADAVVGERLAHQVARRAAAHFARKRHRHRR